MVRAGHDCLHRKHAFGLAFPKKCSLDFRFAYERRCLIACINPICRHHRDGKGDRDFIARRDRSLRWLDDDSACIRFCVRRWFLFVFLADCSRQTNECENEKERRAFHRRGGSSSLCRRRSASASCTFPMRRSASSRAFNATADSRMASERVCDSTAAEKLARCASRRPR